MNDKSKARTNETTIDETGREIQDPRRALSEQTLAVELAGVEIDRAIATAHRFPRSLDVVVKKITTLATYNMEAAENCVYSLPRASKPIIGASIGFANVVAQAWGNCRVASQIVFIDTKAKVVIAQGAFMDLETNAQSIVPVNRRIVDSKGRLYSEDMQIVTGMAAASIARRNAILQGVSRGIWFPIFQAALNVVRGTVETFEEYKARALKAMTQFGVTPEKVYLALGLGGEKDLTYEHIPHIRGMYASLRDGTVTVEEMFDPRRMTGRGFETVENPLADPGAPIGDFAPEPEGGAATAAAAGANGGSPAAPGDGGRPTPPPAQNNAQAANPGPAQATEPAKPADPVVGGAGGAATTATSAPNPTTKIVNAAEPAAKPKNEEEFMDYWEGFCGRATSLGALQNQWVADRDLRKHCRIVVEYLDAAVAMRTARERELTAAVN